MKNKIYRNIDGQGRVSIPRFLWELMEIKCGDTIAFMAVGDDMISFEKFEQSLNIPIIPIIGKAKLDEKGRIIIPKEFREGVKSVEIFMHNGRITIR